MLQHTIVTVFIPKCMKMVHLSLSNFICRLPKIWMSRCFFVFFVFFKTHTYTHTPSLANMDKQTCVINKHKQSIIKATLTLSIIL